MLVPPFPKQVTNNCYASSSSLRQRGVLTISLALVLIGATACSKSSSDPNVDSRGIIVVNAPATGEVRRILVSEGVAVGAGAPILEIAVQTEMPVATPTPGESAEARAARNLKSADAEIEAARAEAVRHDAEVQRLAPLVANGEASAAQLEGERALFERAQRRLQQAQDAKRNAEGGLLAARQPEQNQAPAASMPREKIVAATASSAGTVSVINARVGDRVKEGQPLATLRSNQ
jgi:biotin carboxyl carrier protein